MIRRYAEFPQSQFRLFRDNLSSVRVSSWLIPCDIPLLRTKDCFIKHSPQHIVQRCLTSINCTSYAYITSKHGFSRGLTRGYSALRETSLPDQASPPEQANFCFWRGRNPLCRIISRCRERKRRGW